MTEYLIVIEGSDGSFSAYVPDLAGCVASGSTREEVEDLIREAIRLHIQNLQAHGEPVPEPKSVARSVAI